MILLKPKTASVASLPTDTSQVVPDLSAAYRYCEEIARDHHENFPVASFFLPRALRPHVFAVYAFTRCADNFADEPEFAGRREELLDQWEDSLRNAYYGVAKHPVFVALADTVDKFELPIAIFENLLTAFRRDLQHRRFATWNELLGYVEIAAKPVARALLYIYGYRDSERHRFGEELATALALTNFWQDISSDLARNRIYVPHEELRHFGLSYEDLTARRSSRAMADMMHSLCARARMYYERAKPLVFEVRHDLGVEVALMWHGGRIALNKVEGRGCEVLRTRPALNAADKARAVTASMRDRGSSLLYRV